MKQIKQGILTVMTILILLTIADFVLMTKSHNTKTAALFAKYDVMNRFAQKQIIKQTKNEIVDYSQFLDFNKPRTSTDYIFLHCTDTETATLAAVANYHMFRKNWPSIAYHYLVMKDGKIIRCLKPESESTHAKGFNFNSVSICFEGDFDVDTISQTQYNSGLRLLFALHTKYPNAEITTHAEHSKKTCPGLIFPDDKMEYQALNFHFLNLVKK